MNIRSITLMADPNLDEDFVESFFSKAKSALHIPVQTVSLAAMLFPEWLNPSDPYGDAAKFAELWGNAGADSISLGPVLIHNDASWLDSIADFLLADGRLSACVKIVGANGYIDIGRSHLIVDLGVSFSQTCPGVECWRHLNYDFVKNNQDIARSFFKSQV